MGCPVDAEAAPTQRPSLSVWFLRFVPPAFSLLIFAASCSEEAHQPPYSEIVELSGTAYERGFQHGRALETKIRELYTQLLTSSLLPWLNREKPGLEDVLVAYKDPAYGDGQFSYKVLLESGQNLLKDIPQPYVEEMQGVADGSGMPFEQILVLNTFVDTMLSMRAITMMIQNLQAPHIQSVEFSGDVGSDGVDNNGDGTIDEPGEGLIAPYEPLARATMVEVPTDAAIRFVLKDPDGPNPDSIRIQLDEEVYRSGDSSIETATGGRKGELLEVLFTPPRGLPRASVVSMTISAGDLSLVTNPPPAHARMMRDERIVFTTRGFGKPPHEVPNKGAPDNRYQPPSIGFALRNSATADGRMLVAHHFALLDSNTSHKHTILYVHRPKEGMPHVVLGWSGVIWGFSGMNRDGLVYIADLSDTLDNQVVARFLEDFTSAKLLSSGIPGGILGREMLARSGSAGQALEYLARQKRTFGWNIIVADPTGEMVAVECDSNIQNRRDKGFFAYTPDASDPANLDRWGMPWASVGPDDLRIASHFQRNTEDFELTVFGHRVIPPQRYWTSFYYRSLRAFFILGERIAAGYGRLDVPGVIDILRVPDLVDHRDSMNAAIYDPRGRILYYAMGEVPATDGPFVPFNAGAALGEPR
jgi:hypothetical protein